MTPEQLSILRHSLGIGDDGTGREYRNHFVTAPESDDGRNCEALVADGLMCKPFAPNEITGGDQCYRVTDAGKEAARAKRKPMTRSQQRYQRFLDADCGMSFIEWCREEGRLRKFALMRAERGDCC